MLVIDVQQGYMEQYAPALLQEINRCIEAAQQTGVPVVYIKNVRRLQSVGVEPA
nr:isochorismatase family protein [Butyricicoccus faecihominis]